MGFGKASKCELIRERHIRKYISFMGKLHVYRQVLLLYEINKTFPRKTAKSTYGLLVQGANSCGFKRSFC